MGIYLLEIDDSDYHINYFVENSNEDTSSHQLRWEKYASCSLEGTEQHD